MPPFFDEDVRIRDREIRELNRERLMKYYCLSNKKSDYEYSGGYFTMIKSSIDLKSFTTRESSE